ncbi:MAG TPA: VWA domain-containing protein [Steroidobacteraceae bacterium]|nr:VWA domain-containing protein [Steroidobacteraceae bacterium]
MLVRFFLLLKSAGIPVSITELLTLLEALEAGLTEISAERFYHLARTCLVKDERHYDRFDQAFAAHFKGAEELFKLLSRELPADWLEKMAVRDLSEAEKAEIAALGGWDKLMETLKQRLAEQQGRHQGGSKWIGTAGTSPFGAYGYNPEGVRIGQDASRNRSAVKVWDRREFANLDDSVELGTRNMKMALRKLRRFARRGAPTELALADTIDATARSGGWLDIKMVPERHNVIKILLLLDIGGSMDDHVKTCEELFSAARSEFKHLEHFYFHNCPYEALWRDNRRRYSEHVGTVEVMRTYASDYKLILVGDATMSPYEISTAGGSIEHWNREPGGLWLQRLIKAYPKFAWINPQPQARWRHTASVEMIREILEGRMYPLTLAGLDDAIEALL